MSTPEHTSLTMSLQRERAGWTFVWSLTEVRSLADDWCQARWPDPPEDPENSSLWTWDFVVSGSHMLWAFEDPETAMWFQLAWGDT